MFKFSRIVGLVGKQNEPGKGRSFRRRRLQEFQFSAPSKFSLCLSNQLAGLRDERKNFADIPLMYRCMIRHRGNFSSANYQKSTPTRKSTFVAQNSSVPFASMEAIVVSLSLYQRITPTLLSKWRANARQTWHYPRWQRSIASIGHEELATKHYKRSELRQRTRKWGGQKTMPIGTNSLVQTLRWIL